MLTDYIAAAMRHATYEMIEDENPFYGEIPVCPGVWANQSSSDKCTEELQSVLEEWILLHIRDRIPLPIIDGMDMTAWAKEDTLVPESEW